MTISEDLAACEGTLTWNLLLFHRYEENVLFYSQFFVYLLLLYKL